MKLRITILIASIFVSMLSFGAPAKTVYSYLIGGSWTNGLHWSQNQITTCVCTPNASKDIIYIKHNMTSASGLTFGSGSELHIQNSSKLTITGNTQFSAGSTIVIEPGSEIEINGNLVFKNGTSVDVQSGGTLTVVGDVTNENSSDDINVDGDFNIDGSFTGENGSKIITGGGSLTTTGSATLNGSGTIFGNGTGCVGPCNYGAALPIELLSFEVTLESDKSVRITWATAMEKNNDFFTIERGTNGITFEEIEEIIGAGDSNEQEDYETYDNSPLTGTSYYRLKQTDFDGQYEYFKVLGVSLEEKLDGSCILTVYPNPCYGNCTVNMTECDQETAKIQVLDATGHMVYSDVPSNQSDGAFSYSLNTSNNFTPGVYFINTGSLPQQTKKVIIE